MRLILTAIIISIFIVILSYAGFSWYYSRWDVKPFDMPKYIGYIPPAPKTVHSLRLLAEKGIENSSDTSGTSMETIDTLLDDERTVIANKEQSEEMKDFADFVMNHDIFDYGENPLEDFIWRYNSTIDRDKKIDIGLEIIDYIFDFHDFMLGIAERLVDQRIPFAVGSDDYQMIKYAVDTYDRWVAESDDPFLRKALSSEPQPREESPELIELRRRHDEWLKSQ